MLVLKGNKTRVLFLKSRDLKEYHSCIYFFERDGGLPLWRSHHGQLKPVVPLFPQSLETFIFGIKGIFSNIPWFMCYWVLPLSFLEAGGWELCFFCLREHCRIESKGWQKPLTPFALCNYWVTKEVAGCFRGEKDESQPSREQRSKAGTWMERVTEVCECQIRGYFLLCGIHVMAS